MLGFHPSLSYSKRLFNRPRNREVRDICITLLFMYAHAKKCHSSAKKIVQFKFSSFQEIFFVKIIVTYLKEKDKLNNRLFKQ